MYERTDLLLLARPMPGTSKADRQSIRYAPAALPTTSSLFTVVRSLKRTTGLRSYLPARHGEPPPATDESLPQGLNHAHPNSRRQHSAPS